MRRIGHLFGGFVGGHFLGVPGLILGRPRLQLSPEIFFNEETLCPAQVFFFGPTISTPRSPSEMTDFEMSLAPGWGVASWALKMRAVF